MPQLTDKQQDFVRYYVENGGNASKAARDAGYGESSAHATAWHMLRQNHIMEAVKYETLRAIAIRVPLAQAILVDLAENAQNESVKLKAAEALLDRGGLQLAQSLNLHVRPVDERTDEELIARCRELQKELGIDLSNDSDPETEG